MSLILQKTSALFLELFAMVKQKKWPGNGALFHGVSKILPRHIK